MVLDKKIHHERCDRPSEEVKEEFLGSTASHLSIYAVMDSHYLWLIISA
jgi:hypothetical protein